MRALPLNALRAFATIYARGGVRAAALELRTSHSSVSRQLRELEAWLGIPLASKDRGRRTLAFTPQGEALGRAALDGLRELQSAVTSLKESRSSRSVAIGTTSSFAVRWLLPRLPRFEASHPHVELSIVVDRGLNGLKDGGLDLVISMGRRPYRDLNGEPLADDALYPVMSPDYWKRWGRASKLSDLTGLRLLHDRDPNTTWESWKEEYGPETLDARKGPRFTSTDLVLRAASQGLGVALARHQLVKDDLKSGLLCRPIEGAAVRIKDAYWILLPRHLSPRPAVQTVIVWLKHEARA